VNRNLITRLGLAGGIVAAGVAMVFLVMIVAIRDQRDATSELRKAQEVVATASVLQSRLADQSTTAIPIIAGQRALRRALADEPDQLARLRVVEQALLDGDAGRAVDALSSIVVIQSQKSRQSRQKADDSANRAVVLGVIGLIGSTLLIAGMTIYLANAIVVPLRRTTRAARRIAEGDLSSRVKEEGDAEPRELARAFNQMAANLQESERQKDEFFALVSHELRTPLTSIIGYLELVLDAEDLSDDDRRFLEIVERNARRLLRLVGDMLFIAQVEAGRLTLERGPVDLLKVARESVDAAQPSAQRDMVTLTLDGAPVGIIEGDFDRLGQTIDNLISNALKFTPKGKEIAVRVADTDHGVEVAVSDQGAGIPADDLNHLFERFYRSSSPARRAVPGVGLGLAIVKTIIDAHDGVVWITSEEGTGTTVTFTIPHPAATAQTAGQDVAPAVRDNDAA